MAQKELPFGKHHAFIIGINAYPTHPLISAKGDAERIATLLRGLDPNDVGIDEEETPSEDSSPKNNFEVHSL